MDELGFDFSSVNSWFPHEQEHPFVLVKMKSEEALRLAETMAVAMRRCYIADSQLTKRATELGISQLEILCSTLPDKGATMAGDFGEILGYFYQSNKALPAIAIGAKKWRLKQDRTKPAPKSDVIHFVMPDRPNSSTQDAVLCSEVKLKSTAGSSTPIKSAIEDCAKDRTSRLALTLVWLRERAMRENLGDIDVQLLNRFIDSIDHPQVAKRFRAVAVICENLLTNELQAVPSVLNPDFTLVVIALPNLKETYEAVFAATINTTPV